MINPKTLAKYLLSQLRNEPSLQEFKRWFLGEPPETKYPSSPWGWVEWTSKRQTPGTVINVMDAEDNFNIVLVVKHPDHEKGENKMMSHVIDIEKSLAEDRTLGGQVRTSWVSDMEKWRPSPDRAIIAAQITLKTKRRKTD